MACRNSVVLRRLGVRDDKILTSLGRTVVQVWPMRALLPPTAATSGRDQSLVVPCHAQWESAKSRCSANRSVLTFFAQISAPYHRKTARKLAGPETDLLAGQNQLVNAWPKPMRQALNANQLALLCVVYACNRRCQRRQVTTL
jgi:hypothetical protein